MSVSLIILFPLLGALFNGTYALLGARRNLSPNRSLVNLFGVGLPAASFIVTLLLSLPFLKGAHEPLHQNLFSWIQAANFKVSASFLLDRLSVVMCLIITGVGSLIHLYSTGYMKEDPGYAKYFAYLNLFLSSMLILVLGDNLLMLFLGWEGVGLCSYLLIGFWFEDPEKAKAGKKAFVVNRVGDFGFLIGIFMIIALLLPQSVVGAEVLNFEYLRQHANLLTGSATLITLFLFLGATGKSAQIPLYVWLPDAMAGPTPVSALIHAATMVTAGVYMIARLDFLFTMAPKTLEIIAIIGTATALFASLIAITQNDIKKVLAYSTISQLGYMFLAMGVGAYTAGIFHLMTHAFFKACLFLGAGSVIHGLSGEQDMRYMGGLRKAMPWTMLTFLLATLAIAGLPPFSGFFSKDEILWEAYRRGHTTLWALGFASAGITSFYMFRLFVRIFLGESRVSEENKHHLHESPWNMTLVLVILGILSLAGGWIGIPHVLGGHNLFHEWLHLGIPVSHDSAGSSVEISLMAASVGIALLGALLASIFYLKATKVPTKLSEAFPRIYRSMMEKFYVDEIYNALIIQPIRWTSQNVFAKVVDQKLIDQSLVNGAARLTSWAGSLVNRLQGGLVNRYALYFLMTLALCMLGMVLR